MKKVRKQIHKAFKKIHLLLGLISGSVILLVALSGVILALRHDIEAVVHRQLMRIEAEEKHKSISVLLTDLQQNHAEGERVKSIFINSDPGAAIQLRAGNYIYFYNPYSGEYLGRLHEQNTFFHYLLTFHRRLLLGDIGRWVVNIAVIIFILQLIIGLYIWWPKNGRFRNKLKINFQYKWKKLSRDTHNVFGIVFFLILLTIALTGLNIKFKIISNTLKIFLSDKNNFSHIISEPTISDGHTFSIDYIMNGINSAFPYDGNIWIDLPKDGSSTVKVTKKKDGRILKAVDKSYITFDFSNKNLVKIRTDNTQSTWKLINNSLMGIHEGSIFGRPTRIVNIIASLAAAWIILSGIFLWWSKWK